MSQVAILICYKAGTLDMLKVCLSAIHRHTIYPHRVVISTIKDPVGVKELNSIKNEFQFDSILVDFDFAKYKSGSNIHGFMLDESIKLIENEFILTLDSDCFPINSPWLSELFDMMEADVGCAGILHPWSPPPKDMNNNLIEWRVRSQHCWETTHVACQLVRKSFIVDESLSYVTGDDTGLDIPKMAKSKGLRVVGFMPTRCALPCPVDFDVEYNRYICLVWGDKIYHHGGFTRTSVDGDDELFDSKFSWVYPKIIENNGAEFLLKKDYYKYKFDKEELIAKEKMNRLFGLRANILK